MRLAGKDTRRLLDASPDPMVVVNADGIIAFANAQVGDVFGHEPSALVGRSVECLLPERYRDRHTMHRAGFFARPVVRPMGAGLELYALHKEGHEVPVEISLSPMTTEEGTFVISAIRDVTAQREIERELAEANRAKNRFLAAASHDLRQPLQALSLLNGAALRLTAADPALKRIVEGQRRALDAMSGLLNSLLDISKLDAGLVVPSPRDFPVQELFDRLRANFEEQAQEKRLELTVEATAEAAYTDPLLLQQILFNLVANAVRYTHEGRISVSCVRRHSRLRLEVADTGIGIPDDETERIFDEFYQVDHGVQRPDGLGLGLSIVQRLARLLEYEVSVESAPGRGTTFGILVPAGRVAAPIEQDGLTPDPPRGARVLIVDDEPEVAEATRLLLEIEGFEATIVCSAREAIEHVRRLRPDIVVSDYHLRGGETGIGVVVTVRRELDQDVPVVFVTGDTARSIVDHGLANAELLTKPIRDDELLIAIRRRLAGS